MSAALTPEQAAQLAAWRNARQLQQRAEDSLRRSAERAARRLIARTVTALEEEL